MTPQFSQSQLQVRPSTTESARVAGAREQVERTLVRLRGQLVGSVMALEHPRRSDAASHRNVFLRENRTCR